MNELMKPILKRLIQARKHCGYSQADIAKLMEIAQTHVSSIEKGKVRLTVEMLFTLAEKYGVSPIGILTGGENTSIDANLQHLLIDLDAAAKYIQHAKDTLKGHSDE